ncbi:MAG: SCP2 sterol-binding domain-containing protein [Desulfobacterales bacterium]|jgi:epoxyqueuosine reductase QueG
MKLADHPTVRAYREGKINPPKPPAILESAQLNKMALAAGADDAGFVDLSRDAMADFRQDLLDAMPATQSVMTLVFRVNQNHLKSLTHSVADYEFKQVWMEANKIVRQLVIQLQLNGIKALNMPAGFPYEATRWPGKMWLTCDKVFAVEAGLGHMGYNRLVLHPTYGASIILGSILLAGSFDQYDQPLDFNPCIQCGLCLNVCPVGAIKKTDDFNFMACYSHNYRERLGGFQNWVEQVVDSKSHAEYRRRVSDSETISMWQHLAIGAQTRCDRCMAVCPAGEEAIGEYLDDRKAYANQYLNKFRNLSETIYVVKGSDAQKHVQSNFPAKRAKIISNGIRPNSAAMFLESLPLVFQTGQSKGLNTVYHFTFTGAENLEGTVTIREKTLAVQEGLKGKPDLHITADSHTWIKFLSKEINLVKALVTRKIKIKGSPKLMIAFAKCFPS